MWFRFASTLAGLVLVAALWATPVRAEILTFNSDTPADNPAARMSWLAAVGVSTPDNLVNFESGFVNGQNISGVLGLFPAGLVIRDTSVAGAVIIGSGAGVIGGSNPVGVFSATHNELAFLELDFTASPVDYVAFQDIDQAGTTGIVTFVGGVTTPISFETTGSSGDSAEFFGIFHNDRPPIIRVQLDAASVVGGLWGIDTIEYGVVPAGVVPEPSSVVVLGLGTIGLLGYGWQRRRRSSQDPGSRA